MNNIFLIGDSSSSHEYVDRYLRENSFTPFEVEYFDDPIKIETARTIKNILSYKVPTKKIFIFRNSCTVEAQNALLKNMEEAMDNIYFLFSSSREDALLPTVRSRCLVIKLTTHTAVNEEIADLVNNICESNNDWSKIDELILFLENNNLDDLIPALRYLLLANINKVNVTNYFQYCKKSLPLISLSKTNNMNHKIIIESIFL